MKKKILIFCAVLATLGLMAFGYINWNHQKANPDLLYKVDSRFMATITKEDLHKATSVLDIVPKEAKDWWEAVFQTVTVAVLHDSDEISAAGDDKVLNAAQIKLLQSADYSANFFIKARSTTIHPETGRIEDYVYYFTILPEKEAEYYGGYDALITWLKENSKAETAIIKKDRLQPGRVAFTVTKEGSVTNVKLTSTSGYPSVDETLVELIANMPGKWRPAENSKGEKVDQELVFFFGLEGC